MKAAITKRVRCGFWDDVYKVYLSSTSSYSATAARGSIAFGITRLLVTVSSITLSALPSASAVAASSPNSQSK